MNGLGIASAATGAISTGLQIGQLLADTRFYIPAASVSGVGMDGFYYVDPGTGTYLPGLRAASASRQMYMENLAALYARESADVEAMQIRQKGSADVGQMRVRVGRSGVVSSGSANDVQISIAQQAEIDAVMAIHKGRIESDMHIGKATLAEYDKLLAEASYVGPTNKYSGGRWFSGDYIGAQSGGKGPDYVGAGLSLLNMGAQGYAISQNPTFQSKE